PHFESKPRKPQSNPHPRLYRQRSFLHNKIILEQNKKKKQHQWNNKKKYWQPLSIYNHPQIDIYKVLSALNKSATKPENLFKNPRAIIFSGNFLPVIIIIVKKKVHCAKWQQENQ
uniref:Uncharacterized protein n=1 Tax=Megaselia scalaris TaxID=36166 RepID=T1GGY4_MEGSC